MAVTFKFSTIDDSLGIDGTFLTGINNSGQIVGDFFDSNSFERGFLYGGGSYTTLVDPSAPFGTIASGINGTGQIVGYYSDFSGLHGFLYAAGNYTTLDGPVTTSTVSYPPLTEALGINDIGQVVGYYVTRDTPSTSSAHGYLYGGGNYITLDDPSAIFLG